MFIASPVEYPYENTYFLKVVHVFPCQNKPMEYTNYKATRDISLNIYKLFQSTQIISY
jgi:hypothetical protein